MTLVLPNYSDISFVDLKQVPDGSLAYTNSLNNWLEVVDGNMEQLAVAESRGLEGLDIKREHLIQSSTYDIDLRIYLWTAGNAELGIVDLTSMEYDLVPLLGGCSPGDYLPVSLVSADYGRKVLSVCTKKTSDTFYVKYWQKREIPEPPNTVSSEYIDHDRRPNLISSKEN